mmetsp:Transcript_114111/g.333549  ORF Transcript_114111/g.333549 Transcript_114111/m.333549 type:complete len:248 (+) Transcript_114111:1089-1832(+)
MTSVRPPTGRTMQNSKTTEEMMASSEEGSNLATFNGILGKNSMMSMAVIISANMHQSLAPLTQCFSSPCPSLKGWSCDQPITIANPLQKPSMTEPGTSEMNLKLPVSQISSMKQPHTMTDGKSNSMPSPLPPGCVGSGMSVAMMAAKAPSAPLTMPVRPPKRLHIKPTTQAACIATCGLMCAMKANATDSGIWAKQMVMPSATSVLTKAAFSVLVMRLQPSTSKNSSRDDAPTNHFSQLSCVSYPLC